MRSLSPVLAALKYAAVNTSRTLFSVKGSCRDRMADLEDDAAGAEDRGDDEEWQDEDVADRARAERLRTVGARDIRGST